MGKELGKVSRNERFNPIQETPKKNQGTVTQEKDVKAVSSLKTHLPKEERNSKLQARSLTQEWVELQTACRRARSPGDSIFEGSPFERAQRAFEDNRMTLTHAKKVTNERVTRVALEVLYS